MSSGARPLDFQYASRAHQAETALAGMWLFLATEVLFFGGLFLCFVFGRHDHPLGFDAGARATQLWVGAVNTVLLITSSLSYAIGVVLIRAGRVRGLMGCCAAALALGGGFVALKFGWEWRQDFAQHLFPSAPDFNVTGADQPGARLFFVWYFIATGLHGLHMLIGVALVAWIIVRARRGDFAAGYHTPVLAVGLYWSFVDMVWLVLFPLIYLLGRP